MGNESDVWDGLPDKGPLTTEESIRNRFQRRLAANPNDPDLVAMVEAFRKLREGRLEDSNSSSSISRKAHHSGAAGNTKRAPRMTSSGDSKYFVLPTTDETPEPALAGSYFVIPKGD